MRLEVRSTAVRCFSCVVHPGVSTKSRVLLEVLIMFEFSYHDQMQMVLWLLWWFIFVCRFCGMRTANVVNVVNVTDEGDSNDVLAPNFPVKSSVDALYPIRNAYRSVAPVAAYSGLSSQADAGINTSSVIDYALLTIRELKAECKLRTGTEKAIKGYSRMSKAALIAALSAQ